ncbi:MAG: hypothetical protein ACTSUE_23665 [Promethearchaeota archaeon]
MSRLYEAPPITLEYPDEMWGFDEVDDEELSTTISSLVNLSESPQNRAKEKRIFYALFMRRNLFPIEVEPYTKSYFNTQNDALSKTNTKLELTKKFKQVLEMFEFVRSFVNDGGMPLSVFLQQIPKHEALKGSKSFNYLINTLEFMEYSLVPTDNVVIPRLFVEPFDSMRKDYPTPSQKRNIDTSSKLEYELEKSGAYKGFSDMGHTLRVFRDWVPDNPKLQPYTRDLAGDQFQPALLLNNKFGYRVYDFSDNKEVTNQNFNVKAFRSYMRNLVNEVGLIRDETLGSAVMGRAKEDPRAKNALDEDFNDLERGNLGQFVGSWKLDLLMWRLWDGLYHMFELSSATTPFRRAEKNTQTKKFIKKDSGGKERVACDTKGTSKMKFNSKEDNEGDKALTCDGDKKMQTHAVKDVSTDDEYWSGTDDEDDDKNTNANTKTNRQLIIESIADKYFL